MLRVLVGLGAGAVAGGAGAGAEAGAVGAGVGAVSADSIEPVLSWPVPRLRPAPPHVVCAV